MKSFEAEVACHPALSLAHRMRERAHSHRLWQHPFVERCRAGHLSHAEIQVLAVQMYKFSREFPGFLAGALVHCEDEAARIVIAENLWEELGEGDPAKTHAELFRRFTRALGIDDGTLEAAPMLPGTQHLVDTYRALSRQADPREILSALCYASEGIVAALYTLIQGGLLNDGRFSREALCFFEVHVAVDDGHADKLEALLLPMLATPGSLKAAEAALDLAMNARCRFFDSVMDAVHATATAAA